MPSFISITTSGPVGVLTFRRPEAMNAWHSPMRGEIVEAIEAFERDDTVRAVVMTGEGQRAFGAGQDLKEAPPNETEIEAWVQDWGRFFGAVRHLSKPSVAALNGVAAGSAFQLALLTDFRIAHPGVRIGQPEINAGVASSTGPWIISEILGIHRATDLALTGRLMDVEECRTLGLFNRVVPAEAVLDEALSLALELAAKPRRAMALTKLRIAALTEAGWDDALTRWPKLLRDTRQGG